MTAFSTEPQANSLKAWVTELQAIDPKDGELKTWGGPPVYADTEESAREYLDKNGLGFCKILGEHVPPSAIANEQDGTEGHTEG